MFADCRTLDMTRGAEREDYQLTATDWARRAGLALVFAIFTLESRFQLGSALRGNRCRPVFPDLTGGVQLAGIVLLLVPLTARLGTTAIASPMVGATVTRLVVLDIGGAARSFPLRSCRSSSRRDGMGEADPQGVPD